MENSSRSSCVAPTTQYRRPRRYLNWGADLTGKSKNAVVNKSEPGWSPFGINRVEMLEK